MADIQDKFDKRLRHPEPNIVDTLARIDEIKGHFKADLHLSPQTIAQLKRSVLITSAGSSTRIEGAKLSDREVEKILQGLSISKFADRDSQEIQGYLETLQNVFDNFEHLPLRENIVFVLHRELLKYSVKDELQRGRYKQKENIVGTLDAARQVMRIIFQTTPAYLTPKETQELIAYTVFALENRRFHPLLCVANFIIEFLKIHPFEDGNGRLSRILTNLLLLRADYRFAGYVSHDQIIERRKDEYYFALRASQRTFGTEGETIAPWLNFFFSVIAEQATKAQTRLGEERTEDMLSPKQLEVWNYIATREEVSPVEVVKATGIVMATVRQSLARLVSLGKVKRIGRGSATRYIKVSSK
ncbi:MAG: Fic family protein [Parcubacteria group bacterium]|nr:Fic family protein [Parcubacteria group bacterium]